MIYSMWLIPIICLSLLGSSAHAESLANNPLTPSTEHSWVQFYVRDFPDGRLSYFYDASSLQRSDDILAAHWKVIGSPDEKTTFYTVEIECREGTFTEKGTVLINSDGSSGELPTAELLVDQPIEQGTSGDIFRRTFCR